MSSTSPMPTMFEHGPSDRMQLLGAGELPVPGSCVICGSSDPERKFVFLGVHLDFLGALLLCDMCLTQAAEKVGCMAPSVATMLHLQDQQLASDLTEAQRIVEAQRDRLETYDGIFRSVNLDPLVVGNSIDGHVGSDEPVTEPTINDAQSESSTGESEPDESSEIHGTTNGGSDESSDLTAGSGNSEPATDIKL